MSAYGDWHIGRGWPGTEPTIENECPCPQQRCGLIAHADIDPDCPQHGLVACKTMRNTHAASSCPGAG